MPTLGLRLESPSLEPGAMKMTWVFGTCWEDTFTVKDFLFRQLHQLDC